MKKVVFAGLFLITFFSLIATSSVAAMVVLEDKRVKVVNLMVAPGGIEFVARKLRGNNVVNMTPASAPECANQFIVLSGADNFDVKAAVLLTAKAKNQKIMLEYDIDSTDCWVEVISVGLAK